MMFRSSFEPSSSRRLDSDIDFRAGLQFHFRTITIHQLVVDANFPIQIVRSIYHDLRLLGFACNHWLDDFLYNCGKRDGWRFTRASSDLGDGSLPL